MILEYCPACAEPLAMQSDTIYVCQDGHPYYNNPRASAAVVFLQEDRVLLVKRSIEPRRGKYCLPGGFLEYNENPYQAARREVKEETGLVAGDLEIIDVLSSYYNQNTTSCATIFLAKSWHGTVSVGDDADGYAWMPLEALESALIAWQYPGFLAKLQQIADNK